MSIAKLIHAIGEKFGEVNLDTSAPDVVKFIEEYSEQQQNLFKSQKNNGQITFGKYRGYTVRELLLVDKGRSYLEWLLQQEWFGEERYNTLKGEIMAEGIKKKTIKRTPLQ